MTLYVDNRYALGLAFTPTGTASVSAASPLVLGAGTLFVAEFAVGDVIIINGEVRLVAVITDNTHLAASADYAASATGQVIGGVSLPALQLPAFYAPAGITPPKGIFVPYSAPLDLGDGGQRGGGWPTAEWRWGFLPRAMRDALRGAFFSSAGTPAVPVVTVLLCMRTSVNNFADQFQVFRAQALWPQTEDRQATRRMGFTLRFRAMVRIT